MYAGLRRRLITFGGKKDRELRARLEELEVVLAGNGEGPSAERVRTALDAGGDAVAEFLVSHTLWGGAGSIADQACIGAGAAARRSIEGILARLGAEQMRRDLLNPRTRMWTEAFAARPRDEV